MLSLKKCINQICSLLNNFVRKWVFCVKLATSCPFITKRLIHIEEKDFDTWYKKFKKEMQSDPFHELYL
jgi:hypothetical protein